MANTTKHYSDRAKREFTVDSKAELKTIRQHYNEYDDTGRAIKPKFFGHVARQKGYYDIKKKNYKPHNTTMDHLQKCLNSIGSEKTTSKYLPFSAIVTSGSNNSCVDYEEVERILSTVLDTKKSIQNIWSIPNSLMDKTEKYSLVSTIQQDCINYIDGIRLTKSTMRYLLHQIEQPENSCLQRTMFYSLFGAPNKSFYELLVASMSPVMMLAECDYDPDICLFDIGYMRIVA